MGFWETHGNVSPFFAHTPMQMKGKLFPYSITEMDIKACCLTKDYRRCIVVAEIRLYGRLYYGR